MKKVTLSNAAEREFKSLPARIQKRFALDLQAICEGSTPFSKVKPLSSIGPGVIELKVNGRPAFRCVCVTKNDTEVFVLHLFKKTTNGVDRPAMELAEKRYKDIKKLL